MRREAPEPGGAEAEGSGGSSGGSTVGPGEKTWGSQEEEEGDGRAAVEGPGSSEERNKVVEDWESKVLGSESEMRLGTSVMAGSPVPRVEDSGVVEWMDGDVIWLR